MGEMRLVRRTVTKTKGNRDSSPYEETVTHEEYKPYGIGGPVPADVAVGTVVCLASGGPVMTVLEVSGEAVTSQWFDGEGKLLHMLTPAAMLRLAE